MNVRTVLNSLISIVMIIKIEVIDSKHMAKNIRKHYLKPKFYTKF